MRIRVKVVWDGNSWAVDLPEYSMIEGSFLPLIPDVIHADGVYPDVDPTLPQLAALSCEVEVPDRILDLQTGRPDTGKINVLYRGQPKWGNPEYNPNI